MPYNKYNKILSKRKIYLNFQSTFIWFFYYLVVLFGTYHEFVVFIVQIGFQLFLHLFQSLKLRPMLSQVGIFWDGAWKLLEYLQQLNQNEWDACLAVVLHQILSGYVSKGPTTLQEASVKLLLKLFAKPCFARRFLDSITLCPDIRSSSAERGALNAALQIFEAAYRSSPLAIVTSCASKIVDTHTDSAFLRLECLA